MYQALSALIRLDATLYSKNKKEALAAARQIAKHKSDIEPSFVVAMERKHGMSGWMKTCLDRRDFETAELMLDTTPCFGSGEDLLERAKSTVCDVLRSSLEWQHPFLLRGVVKHHPIWLCDIIPCLRWGSLISAWGHIFSEIEDAGHLTSVLSTRDIHGYDALQRCAMEGSRHSELRSVMYTWVPRVDSTVLRRSLASTPCLTVGTVLLPGFVNLSLKEVLAWDAGFVATSVRAAMQDDPDGVTKHMALARRPELEFLNNACGPELPWAAAAGLLLKITRAVPSAPLTDELRCMLSCMSAPERESFLTSPLSKNDRRIPLTALLQHRYLTDACIGHACEVLFETHMEKQLLATGDVEFDANVKPFSPEDGDAQRLRPLYDPQVIPMISTLRQRLFDLFNMSPGLMIRSGFFRMMCNRPKGDGNNESSNAMFDDFYDLVQSLVIRLRV